MKQPLAYVHPEAQVADNVVIEPFVTIDKNVVIEEGTRIGSNVTILEGAHIGKNCKIFPGAVIAAVPQDLKFRGEKTIVKIGDNCLIMAYAHIAHDCKIGNNCIITNACQLAGEVVVDDFAILGGMTAVHQFVHIGKHVMIQGGSLIGKDVPPYVKAGRLPLSYVGVNSIGLRRREFSNEKINEIQDIYRILYQSGLNNSDAIERIEAEMPASRERDEIIMFVRNTKRGIMKGYMG